MTPTGGGRRGASETRGATARASRAARGAPRFGSMFVGLGRVGHSMSHLFIYVARLVGLCVVATTGPNYYPLVVARRCSKSRRHKAYFKKSRRRVRNTACIMYVSRCAGCATNEAAGERETELRERSIRYRYILHAPRTRTDTSHERDHLVAILSRAHILRTLSPYPSPQTHSTLTS